jgi:cytochrome b subunit of formate dehydrogenase
MNYRELMTFGPIESGPRLLEANEQEAVRRLVSRYRLSASMVEALTGRIFPRLRIDTPTDAKPVLVVGGSGTGKTHLLATLSAIAEHADLRTALTHPGACTVDEAARARGAAGADAIAGRFQVIRLELAPSPHSLQHRVFGGLAASLAARGLAQATAPLTATPDPDPAPALDSMMTAFHETFPEQGLLLVVDELLDHLRTRNPTDLRRDLDFLGTLGQACRQSRLRVLAGVRAPLVEGPFLHGAVDQLRRIQEHFESLSISDADVRFVLAERLVPKTPEQRALVEAHLAAFASSYGTMRERMAEFVALFPIHPDYPGMLGRIGTVARRGVLRILSDAVARLQDTPVPRDGPGLLAYDSFWQTLREDAALRSMVEVQTVVVHCRKLERALEQHPASDDLLPLARRLVHALAVQRLTTDNIYRAEGLTAAELRDALCPPAPGLDPASDAPAGALLSRIEAALDAIGRLQKGRFLTVTPESRQYYLHLALFKRFRKSELVLHWVNAIPFLLLMFTGASMLTLRFLNLDAAWSALVAIVHKCCAATWVIALPLTVLMRGRVHWPHIRGMLTWGKGDAAWMLQSLRAVYNKKAVIPPAGRFNTGQKINALLVMLYFSGFAMTGLLMFFLPSILFPWYVHAALFFSAMGSTGGHLYLALLNPSTRIALMGIFHGWAPMKYVEHHHSLSLPPSLHAHDAHTSAPAQLSDLKMSRAEMIILIVALLMAGIGALTFQQGRLALARKNFSKRFGDSIQPSRLSTRHEIGPVTESCAKCHLFTGELPNRKCEACHEDIKERRATKSGLHGTMEGDCRKCHREHQGRGKSIIPPFRDEFDHDQTNFKLEGKHADVACDDCHAKTRTEQTPGIYYIGLPHARCADCHRDPHDDQFTRACSDCHSPQGWTGEALQFRHADMAAFPLEGKHATVACAACHKPVNEDAPLASAPFKNLSTECASCHQEPHDRQFSAACTTCHTPAGWQGQALTFNHNRDSSFTLVAKHAEVACIQCHKPAETGQPLGTARFRGLKSECADCHQDPHRGQFGRACVTCHATPTGWSAASAQFDHRTGTAFALIGKHADVACIRCHQPAKAGGALGTARFRGLETGCVTCHPVQHPKAYGTTCNSCHTPVGWPAKSPPFVHQRDTRFALQGKHTTLECRTCHHAAAAGVLEPSPARSYACVTCHRDDDPHRSVLGTTCSKCHSPAGWTGEALLFDHNTMARFVLNRYHRDVACTKCHEESRWKPLDASCDRCHP